jgi:hypothetical protein
VGGDRKTAKWAQKRFINLELRNSEPSYAKKILSENITKWEKSLIHAIELSLIYPSG